MAGLAPRGQAKLVDPELAARALTPSPCRAATASGVFAAELWGICKGWIGWFLIFFPLLPFARIYMGSDTWVLFWSKIWATKRWWEREGRRWFWISYTEVGWLLGKTIGERKQLARDRGALLYVDQGIKSRAKTFSGNPSKKLREL